MNKRGNVLDWFYIMAVLFIVGITTLVSFIVIDKAGEIKVFQDDADANKGINQARTAILNFDNLMLFIIMGLSLFVLISAAVVHNHPAFFFVGIFLLFIAIAVGATVSNTFWTFGQSPTISAAAASYPKLTFIMDNIPFYVAFMGILASIVAYVSYRVQ